MQARLPRRDCVKRCLMLLMSLCVTSCYIAQISAAPSQAEFDFFEKQIRPLLAKHCYKCHSAQAKKLQAGLLLDRRSGLLKGGDSGKSIVPGKPEESLLIKAIRYESFEMPPAGKLDQQQINLLIKWVKMGAPWPDEKESSPGATESKSFNLQERKKSHWVWQPIQNPQPANVTAARWPRHQLDTYVLARLEQKQLKPARQAERRTLIRRLYFDLIGLPPTPDEIQNYLSDSSPDAYEKLVDRLLASPHFGERWGRHWLDLVRYAESRGHEFDYDAHNAYQYRDYVIRAWNEDVPLDQLVREHIAGDLLESPRLHPQQKYNESILGTGFWFLGEWVHSPVDIRKEETDRFDNMLDVMSKTFLGLTVSCARCHDHKFDAISTKDYYSLSGFLQSSDFRQVRFESLEHNRQIAEKLNAIDNKYRKQIVQHLQQQGVEFSEPRENNAELEKHVVVDYRKVSANDFMQDGFLFRLQSRNTPTLVHSNGKPVVRFSKRAVAASDLFWNGLQTHSEKGVNKRGRLANIPRSGRTLRTPTFLLTSGQVSCRVQGAGYVVACVDSHRLIAGPLHNETIREIKPNDRGVVLNLNRYVGHRIHLEFTPAPDTEMKVWQVLVGTPVETLNKLRKREESTNKTMRNFQQKASEIIPQKLIEEWSTERALLQKLIKRKSQIAMAMNDGTGEEDFVLIRGNHQNKGELAPRRFLESIAGPAPMEISDGSGRLELAAAINHRTNPLTTRVFVNRIWHHLMGRGIVPTVDDFGVLGERPTHPLLLDHLASWFRNNQQSPKALIKYIVTSSSYQMSSQVESAAEQRDPKNLLWHRHPLKRLQGEIVRDMLLALAGQLDSKMHGEPVPVHLTTFMDGRGRPPASGPLDGNGRRSIYIAVRRNFLPPFMQAFDAPTPFSTMGRRNVTNVPAQALILMNDPFVRSQAKLWAQTVLALKPADVNHRIRYMFEAAFAREPTRSEHQLAIQFISQQAANHKSDMHNLAVWSEFAHVLFNVKEFIYLR